jgi:flagellin
VTAINADANSSVTASMGQGTDELLITSKVPGVPFTISTTKTFSSGVTGSITSETVVPSQMAPVKSLGMDDLAINGVPIRAATTADDTMSNTVATSSNPASSAIAMASAINASTPETGVRAVPNPVEIKGTGNTITQNTNTLVNGVLEPVVAPIGMQSLYINGTEVQVDFKLNEDADVRRNKVVAAINERTGQHGVTAENNGKGVTLKSDGRNLSVWFDSNVDGLQAASFGLDQGGAKAQVSSIKMGGTILANNTVDVNINGVVVQATVGAITSPTTGPMQAALDMVAAINARVANPTATPPLNNLKAFIDPNDSTSVLLQSTVPGTAFKLNGANSSNAAASVTLDTVQKNSYGDNGITGIQDAMETTSSARTLYGTVRLIAGAAQLPGLPGTNGIRPSPLGLSGKPISISTGADGFGPQSNFSDLGFQVGGFGGRSSEDMDPPRVGRLAFQIGASANQTVTIDLADFGKGGPITGEITGDVDLAVENRSTRINTREGATAVLNLLDTAMDKVNATRATMGAVMNRLDHVINNLTNVSMNMSASRSQIEDADYASASTELAKTQIMQQAATAVLAQANTSQQSVLKLLGN